MSEADEQGEDGHLAAQAVQMLRAVVEGETYSAVAARYGVTRTAVERRVKAIALELVQSIGIDGLNDQGISFAKRLRQHRDAILVALDGFVPSEPYGPREVRVVSSVELTRALALIKLRSRRPWHDQALLHILFVTGARALEVARLEVRDYLLPDGSVRCESQVRAEAAINGKVRPLYFQSTVLDGLLSGYLQERLEQRLGLGDSDRYRGLDPGSRLFLSAAGEGFDITSYGTGARKRHLCRGILEAYRKLFRQGELPGVTSLSARHTVAARLYERGADEDQVGQLLGIGQRSAVRELMRRRKPTMLELVRELA